MGVLLVIVARRREGERDGFVVEPGLWHIPERSSLPGLTRQSINLQKIVAKRDGCAGQARA
jgi:hypothetical protein